MHFLISKNHAEFWISINRIMDIQKSNYGYPKISIIIGYPKFYFRIALNRSDLRISINRFKDIHKSNYGYPKFSMIFLYPKMHLRISKNAFMDIQKSIH